MIKNTSLVGKIRREMDKENHKFYVEKH